MIVKDDVELDLELNFQVDDFDYMVFATTGEVFRMWTNRTLSPCVSKQE